MILVLASAYPLAAATTGTIAIVATDATGAVLPGVTLEATSPVQIGTRTAVTDSKGAAMIAGLVPGRYTVLASLSGFRPTTQVVGVEQNTTNSVTVKLVTESVTESITVTAESPLVDTTRATVSEHVTLSEVEALPVSRDYKGYAQLVTGVNVVPNSGGVDTPVDPQGKGGNNFADRGAEGRFGKTGSTDNTYYIDGLNITDMGNGRGTMTFNNEVILEQEVVTSAVPAEFAGGKGFVGNVVTKSGGDKFSGSVNYYLQKPSMYGGFKTSDSRLHAAQEDKYDAAMTLGGPVVRERAWFFFSGQLRKNTDEVNVSTSASPTPMTTEYLNDRKNYFGKVTLKAGDSTTVIGQVFSDPRKQDAAGNRNPNTVPGRYISIDDTPETMSAQVQHVLGSAGILEGRYGKFEEDYLQEPKFPDLGLQNTIRFPAGVSVPAYQRDLGAASTFFHQVQKRDQGDLIGTFFFDAAGSHTFKAGYQYTKLQDETTSSLNGGARLTSLAPSLSGITFGDARSTGLFSSSEYSNVLTALRREATSSKFFQLADTNKDGTISDAEFAALKFTSNKNNNAGINFLGLRNLEVGTNNVIAKTNSVFLQDDWRMGQWTVNAGVRMEDWEYVASDGSMILDMDPTFSPRLGATWDIGGAGRQKVTVFYGRYHDPIRTDMVHFAGNISGTVNAEQVFIGDDWFNYRLRGSRSVRDAGFAPNLKNQTQDEFAITYGININPTWAFMAQAFRRKDDNLIEDYDPHVYWNIYGGTAGAFALEPGDHGFPPTGIEGPINFYLANAIGGERQTDGLDLTVERRFSGNWNASVQYMWRDAEGNITSDANADLVGDAVEYDPRQPYMYGKLPGTIEHQFKAYGMYRLPWNVEIGGLAYWNSGAIYTRSEIFLPGQYDIFLPVDLTPNDHSDFKFAKRGTEKHPSYYTFDAKLRYLWQMNKVGVDFFFDIYNVFNNQDAIFVESAINDPEFTVYGEDRALLEPRRYQAGVRLRF